MKSILTKYIFFWISLTVTILFQACDDFVEVNPPNTDLVQQTVFTNEKTALAAMSNLYADMAFAGFASGSSYSGYSLLAAFSADEWMSFGSHSPENQQFSDNNLIPTNNLVSSLWSDLYRYIYKSNALLEGLLQSRTLSDQVRSQIEGEARFIRAFSYFYLVNLWGDVPLAMTTDYRVNSQLKRSPASEVYSLIVSDLVRSSELLSPTYSFSSNERIRPNKWVALAMLARVYLFMEEWTKAEEAASSVIDQSEQYSLSYDLLNVFTKNSNEVLWQLHSIRFPLDLSAFTIFSGPSNGVMRNGLVEAFTENDKRFQEWIGMTSGSITHYFSRKYQDFQGVTEYSTVMRLSEQFLIRAEARAHLGKLTGENSAIEDVNVIRLRAGLPEVNYSLQEDLLDEVIHQRRIELFCEWGHRWLDLKRTGRVETVMSQLKPATWQNTDVLYPIPEDQIMRSSILIVQNPGY